VSTILKALQQLEKDEARAAAGLPLEPGDEPSGLPPMGRRRRRGRAWLGIALGVAGVSLITVALLPSEAPREIAQRAAPVAEPTLPEPALAVPAPGIERARPARDATPVEVESPVVDAMPSVDDSPVEVPAPVALASAAEPADALEVASPVDVAAAELEAAEFAHAVEVASPVELARAGSADPAPRAASSPERAPSAGRQTPAATRRSAATSGLPSGKTTQGLALSNDDLAASTASELERGRAVSQAELRPSARLEPAAEPVLAKAPVEPRPAPPPRVEREPEPAPRPAASQRAAAPLPAVKVRAVAGAKPPPELAVRAESVLDAPVARPPEPASGIEPPSLGLERTRWHPQPARREANIVVAGEQRTVREGDQVLGYRIVEITPSSIIFDKNGRTERVRVGAR
jgi:hypothetical protein